MITTIFDPTKSHQAITYLRMSDKAQNPRSPEQQSDTIRNKIKQFKRPWTIVKEYRDDAIKGRLFGRRPGLQSMLRDIESGMVQVSLILVDVWERFGRLAELDTVRRKLESDYGVFVLAADSNFADPTGIAGKALGLVESLRSTEEGRIKAHQVNRGKRDTVLLGRWPGGPAPFGFLLKEMTELVRGKPKHYSILEHDPQTVWVRKLIVHKAADTGWGGVRLAKWLNGSADIPDGLKPFLSSTINYILNDDLNIGRLVWGENNTDIVNDTRVVRRNPNETEIVRFENFCEPVVAPDVYNLVQATREARRKRKPDSTDQTPKATAPLGRGAVLRYPLTGLVVCACGSFMNACTSGQANKAGIRFTYRRCARQISGFCEASNSRAFREDELWRVVIARMRARLYPTEGGGAGLPWLPGLVARITEECVQRQSEVPDRRAAVQASLQEVQGRIQGYQMSLGSTSLQGDARGELEKMFGEAILQRNQLSAELASLNGMERHVGVVTDPAKVVEELQRLDELLAGENATLMNVALSRHIEQIQCFPDGRVIIRGTLLGLFDGAVELLSEPLDHDQKEPPPVLVPTGTSVTPRRRTRRHVPSLTAEFTLTAADTEQAIDPGRFAGIPENFMWQEEFIMEPKKSWAQSNAALILTQWEEIRNVAELARQHGKSIPTIRKARMIARGENGAAPPKVKADLTRPTIQHRDEIAEEAMRMYGENLSYKEMAAKLKVHRNTVKAAVKDEFKKQGLEVPDGRARRSEVERREPIQAARIADEVHRLSSEGLLYEEIGARLNVGRDAITAAVKWWYEQRGLPCPDGRTRRKGLDHKSRRHGDENKAATEGDTERGDTSV